MIDEGNRKLASGKFYPQNGGQDSRFLWYDDSSFPSEVKLWWALASDDKGTIMVHSDNSPYDLLMGGCDNASRVVSHVVVMGQGYSSNPLLDLRVHDLTVEADLTRHAPAGEDPVEADGTNEGKADYEYNNKPLVFDLTMEQAAALLEWYWTGPWPVIHFDLNTQSSPDIGVEIKVKLDLLGNFEFEEVSFQIAGAEDMTEAEADGFVALMQAEQANPESWEWHIFILGSVIGVTLFIAELASVGTFGISSGDLGGWCGTIIFLYLVFINAVAIGLRDSHLSADDALTAFAGFCLQAVLYCIAAGAALYKIPLGIKKAMGYFKSHYKASKPGTPGACGRGSVIIFLTSLIMILMTFAALALMQNGW